MDIKWWLRKNPQPVTLLCDGKKVALASGPRKWADTVETIRAMGATRLEALSADGTVLRVVELDANEVDAQAEEEPEQKAALANVSKLTELAQLAQILGDISDRSARRHEAAYAMAFKEFAGMNAAVLERLSSMEQAWISSLNTISELKMQLADAIAEAKGDNDNSMMGSIVAAAMSGVGGDAGASVATNGKHHPEANQAKKTNGKPEAKT